jgi:hypothetical protein
MPTVLAVVLAFECDNYSLQNQDPAWLSWAEGAALAAVMACAGLLVVRAMAAGGLGRSALCSHRTALDTRPAQRVHWGLGEQLHVGIARRSADQIPRWLRPRSTQRFSRGRSLPDQEKFGRSAEFLPVCREEP